MAFTLGNFLYSMSNELNLHLYPGESAVTTSIFYKFYIVVIALMSLNLTFGVNPDGRHFLFPYVYAAHADDAPS